MGKSLVYGIGVNDADYNTQRFKKNLNNKWELEWICPYYTRWKNLIKRCYNKERSKRDLTYSDCFLCEEWLTFSNFKKWMESQDWEGKELDKDFIKGGNKEYNEGSCVFIEPSLNKFLNMRKRVRGHHPIGVSFHLKTQKFISQVVIGGKKIHLGLYKDSMEAHRAWQLAKRDRALQLQAEQTDSRVIGGLQRIIDKLQHDYENNLETKTL